MHNAHYPQESELPTNKQLITSTLAALAVAGALLVTCVLPAEYGIDPTGIGKTLGLTKMGEIKTQLGAEAATETITEVKARPGPIVKAVEKPPVATRSVNTETMQITLAPAAAAEVKVNLNKGEIVSYSWTVDVGHLNFDNHGDNATTKYHNYSKGKAATRDEGEITAAFDGSHGWFWRNRSAETVTVTLNASAEAIKLKRVL